MAEAPQIPDEAATGARSGAFVWAASDFGALDIGACDDRVSLSKILVEGVE